MKEVETKNSVTFADLFFHTVACFITIAVVGYFIIQDFQELRTDVRELEEKIEILSVEDEPTEAILDTAQQCVNFPVGVDVPDGLDYSGTGEWSFEGITVGHAEFEDEAFYICSDVATIERIMNGEN